MNLRLVTKAPVLTAKVEEKTKKSLILELYKKGVKDVERIAKATGASASYVGSVLQKEGLINNYFDLYTSTSQPMNAYSKYFRGKLGYKDAKTAESGAQTLEQTYRFFTNQQDRAGQHHALEMALTMYNRARWTGKTEEAEIYRRWLVGKLSQPATDEKEEKAQQVELRLVA